jgi:hypothetical protein
MKPTDSAIDQASEGVSTRDAFTRIFAAAPEQQTCRLRQYLSVSTSLSEKDEP